MASWLTTRHERRAGAEREDACGGDADAQAGERARAPCRRPRRRARRRRRRLRGGTRRSACRPPRRGAWCRRLPRSASTPRSRSTTATLVPAEVSMARSTVFSLFVLRRNCELGRRPAQRGPSAVSGDGPRGSSRSSTVDRAVGGRRRLGADAAASVGGTGLRRAQRALDLDVEPRVGDRRRACRAPTRPRRWSGRSRCRGRRVRSRSTAGRRRRARAAGRRRASDACGRARRSGW